MVLGSTISRNHYVNTWVHLWNLHGTQKICPKKKQRLWIRDPIPSGTTLAVGQKLWFARVLKRVDTCWPSVELESQEVTRDWSNCRGKIAMIWLATESFLLGCNNEIDGVLSMITFVHTSFWTYVVYHNSHVGFCQQPIHCIWMLQSNAKHNIVLLLPCAFVILCLNQSIWPLQLRTVCLASPIFLQSPHHGSWLVCRNHLSRAWCICFLFLIRTMIRLDYVVSCI